jgi:hypothetical protein
MCTDTAGRWSGGYIGLGVANPKQMLDIAGRLRVQDMDSVGGDFPVVIWNPRDSTFYLLGLDSLNYLIKKYNTENPTIFGT